MSDKRKKLIRQIQAENPGMSYQAALNQLAEQAAAQTSAPTAINHPGKPFA